MNTFFSHDLHPSFRQLLKQLFYHPETLDHLCLLIGLLSAVIAVAWLIVTHRHEQVLEQAGQDPEKVATLPAIYHHQLKSELSLVGLVMLTVIAGAFVTSCLIESTLPQINTTGKQPVVDDELEYVNHSDTLKGPTSIVAVKRGFEGQLSLRTSPSVTRFTRKAPVTYLIYDTSTKQFVPQNADGRIIKTMMDKAAQLLAEKHLSVNSNRVRITWACGDRGYLMHLIIDGRDTQLLGAYDHDLVVRS